MSFSPVAHYPYFGVYYLTRLEFQQQRVGRPAQLQGKECGCQLISLIECNVEMAES